jgi:hypothetical protein
MAKSFPDLNNDGEVTQADVLKGRGVYKKGGKVKKTRKFMDGGLSGEAASAGAAMGSAAAKKQKAGDPSDLKKAAMSAGLSASRMASGLGSRMGKSAAAGLTSMGRKEYQAPNDDGDYKKGGKVKKMAGGGVTRADGCVMKGHTKGKMVKMAGGGSC